MKILHTADIHLREHTDQRWEALQKLIEVGKKEKADLFVISGDLFDNGADAERLRPVIRQVFSNTGFRIVIIPGNHDAHCYAGGLFFGEDISVLTDPNTPFEHKDVRIWGMPFEPVEGERLLNKLHSVASNMTPQETNILLFHGELLDAFFSRTDFGDEGEQRYMPVRISYFKDLQIRYVLAGHFHSKFDVRKLDNGGYFVYPGSPVSITKAERGQRKANIFEVGKPPGEFALDTPHFEEVAVDLDPFKDKDPLETVRKRLVGLHPQATVILTVKGFIDGATLGIDENEFVGRIKKLVEKIPVEPHYEFKDIRTILQDDLFKSFLAKLERTEHDEGKRRQLRETAIRAMIEARS